MGGDITTRSVKPYGIFYLETKNHSLFFIPDYNSYKNTVTLDFNTETPPECESDNYTDYTEIFTSF